MEILDRISVVLVEPMYGGNVGAVARAMANFGLPHLALVRPPAGLFDDPQLKPMARKGGNPVLTSASTHEKLTDALSGTEVSWGFTTRLGKKRTDGMDLREAVRALLENPPAGRVAAVFGSEDKGLTNDDLEKCSLLVRIPTAPEMASLNLAQAVGVFAYEIHTAAAEAAGKKRLPRNLATSAELEGLYAHLEEVLVMTGFIEEKSPARMMNYMRRLISRRQPDPREVAVLRGILSKVQLAVERAKAGLL